MHFNPFHAHCPFFVPGSSPDWLLSHFGIILALVQFLHAPRPFYMFHTADLEGAISSSTNAY